MTVLYEDNHLISVIKPAGVLSQSDGSTVPDMLSLLSAELAEKYGKKGKAFVGLIHRLDRNVGGTMFFSKTSKGASRAGEDMRTGNFYKGYLAVCSGASKGPFNGRFSEEGYLVNRLSKDARRNVVFESADGKECRLYYKYLCSIDACGDVPERNIYFVIPITGRAHQIRAQFSIAGSPLLGDVKYGNERGGQYELGLWSAIASVRKTTDRSERIWAESLPSGRFWTDAGGELPFAIRAFIDSPEVRTVLEREKGDNNDG